MYPSQDSSVGSISDWYQVRAKIFQWKLSSGEICVANFIPPCEWWKSGSIFVLKIQLQPKNTVWISRSKKIITDRQTDRQTDKFFNTIYRGMLIFSFNEICYSPTPFARRGISNWFGLINGCKWCLFECLLSLTMVTFNKALLRF